MLNPLNAQILVTGGLGFMGSAFIRMLMQRPFSGKVYNLDAMTYAADENNVKGFDRYELIKGDICDRALLDQLVPEVDVVVHFAAESHVDRSISNPLDFVQTNVVGTYQLLDVVRKYPCHFHHVSTDEVYGSVEGMSDERSVYAPNSPYAASKAASDHFVRAYVKTYGLSATVSHASNNYGPCQFPEKFIPVIISNLIEGNPIPVYGDGQNVRDWLYVDDHAKAVLTILEKGQAGEVYNISAEQPMKNIDVVQQIMKAFGKSVEVEFVKDRPGHDLRYCMDGSKMRTLGWEPKISFEEGIAATIEWYHAQKSKSRVCHSS